MQTFARIAPWLRWLLLQATENTPELLCPNLELRPVVMAVIRHHHRRNNHDDVIKWKHFPRYWPFARGIHRSLVNSRHRPVTLSFAVFFFYLRPNQRLSKQWWGWWFETPSNPLWRHCNNYAIYEAWHANKWHSFVSIHYTMKWLYLIAGLEYRNKLTVRIVFLL